MKPTPYDLQRARQKREMAARLRQLAPGLSIESERTLFLRDAERLEAEADRLEGTPSRPSPPQAGQAVIHQQEQTQQQTAQSEDPDKPER
jgi:hypothetical protein